MKKYNKNIILSIFAVFVALLGTTTVNAMTINISNATATQGETVTVNISLSSISTPDGRAYSLGGTINYDSSYLSGSCSSTGKLSGTVNENIIGIYDSSMSSGVGNGTTLVTCSFKTLKQGTTKVSVSDGEVNDSNGEEYHLSSSGGTITINAPKSSNNDLSSLSASGCSINFSSGTTSYSCNVGSDVTSTSISASASDSKASVSGTGSKSLNYGANKFTITVKAENGSTKSYSITINRKDDRSSENSLSALTCSNCTLSPSFSSGTTSYSTSVDYSVSSLKLNYTTKDSKAKVSVSGNTLVVEETVEVKITVTAENGSTKTYTIKATRGKDPNKVLSTDNNLTSLTVSQGILSPAFSSDVTNYAVYLPYEISTIDIDYQVSDTKYAVVNFTGSKDLGVGNNIFTISVKAENDDEKVYTITVVRAKQLNGESSTNALLASLSLTNGTLTEKFDSDVHLYYYNQNNNKEVVVKGIAQDKEAVVTYLEAGAGVYAVLVTAPSGNMSIYIMIPNEKKNIIIYIIIASLILLAIIVFFVVKIIKNKKSKNTNKSFEEKNDIEENNKKHKKEKKSKKEKNKKNEEDYE